MKRALGGLELGLLALAAASVPRPARADCTVLDYTFQPDCFRAPPDGACVFDPRHPDLGPQIAVWLESGDGTSFVDTLMVTNAVAVHGIGNRPGTWDLLSGPRFPYGRRSMALPIWAHARGKLYTSVVMNDGMDDQLTNHENTSSPEPYFCRPMLISELVDAITCATGKFRSVKGRLDSGQPPSYYPPRADLFSFDGSLCLPRIGYPGSCDPGDSARYFAMNDVDVVAAATPPYGVPFTGRWIVPAGIAPGDYRLAVEVAKEFDTNADHQHPSDVSAYDAQYFAGYGQTGNVGQPSVLYRVPIRLGPGAPAVASTSAIAGYGDWTGDTGQVWEPDETISDAPGSGAGRLLTFAGADGPARVQVSQGACPAVDCNGPSPPIPLPVSFTATPTGSGTSVAVTLRQSSQSGGQPVIGYEIRYSVMGLQQPIDPASFPAWSAAGAVPVDAPGSETTTQVDGLAPQTDYAVGVRALGVCGASPTTYQRFETPSIPFKQLSGCFIATAAFGSDLAPEVTALRALRDMATSRSTLAGMAVDLYYRSSPPAAAALARSEVARDLVRAALRTLTPRQ
ncbi:MAG TPA: fibronectin type III domain-containing protein [Polyangia bacterium]|nr:fibronectin type III domain-containing protein [Polyangia bacterium]